MPRTQVSRALIKGHATVEGTRGFSNQFTHLRTETFYRPLVNGMVVSSLGLGTYLGECDDSEDARYISAVIAALERGVNLLDTAINYRCQRSERAIGSAIQKAVSAGGVKREQIVVCTKGGYIPLEKNPPATREDYRSFLEEEYFIRGVMDPADVIAGGHCLSARFLEDQIERSRRNLGVETVDIYYLHNPEQALDHLARPKFLTLVRDAFAVLERAVEEGFIGCYGCATWNGFRVAPEAKNHLSLEELIALAREVAGASHHFNVVQLPINLAMTEAVRAPTQCVGRERVPLLEAAHRLRVSVVGSATLMQSQLTHDLPAQMHTAFPGFATDARRAIAFAQSLPLSSALVGMKSAAHLEENLAGPDVS
ncbi:MAG TPA: aldo/keto reductase [Gemmatimonadaceae bacterium]|nr:aldo/keto reductase [Gemmatimonadaceae bacterium]